MYKIIYTNRFKKDLKRIERSGKSLDKFKGIAIELINGRRLEKKYKDHKLTGRYKNRRECHLEPDWLLIYKIEGEDIILKEPVPIRIYLNKTKKILLFNFNQELY